MINISLFFYILSSIFYFLFFKIRKVWIHKAGLIFFIAGLILNIIFFGSQLFEFENISILHIILTFLSILISLIFITIEIKYKFYIAGTFIMPLILIIILMEIFIPANPKQLNQILLIWGFWPPVHVIFTLISYSVFAVSFCVSCGFLIHEHELKSHHLSKYYFTLPPLESLDEFNYSLITSGIVFLSIGILTGGLWAKEVWGTYWSWDPKQVFSLITWFIYIISLHVRMFYGWRGKRTAYLSIFGFILTIFTFLVSNFFLHGLHSFM